MPCPYPRVSVLPRISLRNTAAALLAFACVAMPAAAADVRAQIRSGNVDFEAGRFDEALAAYDAAAAVAPEALSPQVLHNRAAALFKLGRIEDARESWVRTLSHADAAFEARTRYNLGNCDYADALRHVETGGQNASPALDLLDRAIAQYRDAVRLDPSFQNARANLELATMLKKQIEEQSTSQPSSQDSGDQQQEQGNENNEQQKNDSNQEQGESNNQKEGEGDDSDNAAESGGQQGDASEKPQKDADKPSQNENDAGSSTDNQSRPNPDESQSAEQQQADESPTPQPRESEPGQENAEQQAVQIKMTRDEAARLLQMVRDAEKARREAILQRMRVRQRPVDKDW